MSTSCVFEAQGLKIDPDKGYLHADKLEVQEWPDTAAVDMPEDVVVGDFQHDPKDVLTGSQP